MFIFKPSRKWLLFIARALIFLLLFGFASAIAQKISPLDIFYRNLWNFIWGTGLAAFVSFDYVKELFTKGHVRITIWCVVPILIFLLIMRFYPILFPNDLSIGIAIMTLWCIVLRGIETLN